MRILSRFDGLQDAPPSAEMSRWRRLFQLSTNDDGEQCLIHECVFDCKDGILVHFKTTLSLGGTSSNRLISQLRYRLFSPSMSVSRDRGALWICPHLDLMQFLASKALKDECSCDSTVRRQNKAESKSKAPAVVDVTRFLGKRSWPADTQWFRHCRVIDIDGFYDKKWCVSTFVHDGLADLTYAGAGDESSAAMTITIMRSMKICAITTRTAIGTVTMIATVIVIARMIPTDGAAMT